MDSTYRVGEQGFDSFTDAVAHAKATAAEVHLVSDGRRVWAPMPTSKKRLRYHAEQVAAADAYRRMKNGAK